MKTVRITSLAVATATMAALGMAQGSAGHAVAKTLPATPVTAADLPTKADMKHVNDATNYSAGAVRKGDIPRAQMACATFGWAKFKPNTVLNRQYTARGPVRAQASVASFSTHAKAVAAAKSMGGQFKGCAARIVAANPDITHDYEEYRRTVVLPTGQTAYLWTLNARDGEAGRRFIVTSGVVATGTHVELVQFNFGSTNGSLDTRNIQQVMASAVKTLA